LEHLVLDVNGTIAVGGVLVPGVAEAVEALGAVLHVVAVTADTHGTAPRLRDALGIDVQVIEAGAESEQKLEFVRNLGASRVVAVGNGANDALMLEEAALGVAVIGGEGASSVAVAAADIVTVSVLDALALLAQPVRIAATLRR
jgi:P-type E1-E2 ATPase